MRRKRLMTLWKSLHVVLCFYTGPYLIFKPASKIFMNKVTWVDFCRMCFEYICLLGDITQENGMSHHVEFANILILQDLKDLSRQWSFLSVAIYLIKCQWGTHRLLTQIWFPLLLHFILPSFYVFWHCLNSNLMRTCKTCQEWWCMQRPFLLRVMQGHMKPLPTGCSFARTNFYLGLVGIKKPSP